MSAGVVLRIVAVVVFIFKLIGIPAPVDLTVLGLLFWCLGTVLP